MWVARGTLSVDRTDQLVLEGEMPTATTELVLNDPIGAMQLSARCTASPDTRGTHLVATVSALQSCDPDMHEAVESSRVVSAVVDCINPPGGQCGGGVMSCEVRVGSSMMHERDQPLTVTWLNPLAGALTRCARTGTNR